MVAGNHIALNAFLSGAIALGFAVIAFRFQQFWRHTRIRLFNLFALAFLLMSLERIVEIFAHVRNEAAPLLYLPRLAAFVLIIIAIINHNRNRR